MINTYKAVYENGIIRLADDIKLPNRTNVYVVVPEVDENPVYRYSSPHLVRPEQAFDFVKEIVEENVDAAI